MYVKFRGVRGSLPTPQSNNLRYGGNTTCLEISSRAPDEPVLIDCGTGGRDLGIDLMARDRPLRIHILLTHFHWDHIQGIPYFAPLFDDGMEVVFYANRPVEETRRHLERQMGDPFFPLSLEQVRARAEFRQIERGRRFQVAGLDATCFPLNHPQGAVGYRLESHGAVLAHACDHEHGDLEIDAAVREAANGADLFVMDAQYTPEEYRVKAGWGHSTYAHAAEVATAAQVRRLALFHHDPLHDDSFLDAKLAAAQQLFSEAIMAREGESFDLS